MAKFTYYTYTCPRCSSDLGRRFGLITSKCVDCPRCGCNVRIDACVVQQNWAYNFGWVGGTVVWIVVAAGVLLSPEFAVRVSEGLFRGAGFRHPIAIIAACLMPALLFGLAMAFVGMVLGPLASLFMSTEAAGRGDEQMLADLLGSSSAAELQTAPRPRSLLVRLFFIGLWPAVFFCGGAFVLGMVGTSLVKADEPRPPAAANADVQHSPPETSRVTADAAGDSFKAAAAEFRRKTVPWLVLGTFIVFVLGGIGRLPCTSRCTRPSD